MSKNKVISMIGVVIILLLTYYRENLLLEINALLNNVQFTRSSSYWFYSFFEKMSISDLVLWKWGLTVFFSIMITVFTLASLYFWFGSIELLKFTSKLYIFLFSVVTVIALIGFLFNSFQSIYFLLRKILGVVQSPIPFFIFFLLNYQKENNKESTF